MDRVIQAICDQNNFNTDEKLFVDQSCTGQTAEGVQAQVFSNMVVAKVVSDSSERLKKAVEDFSKSSQQLQKTMVFWTTVMAAATVVSVLVAGISLTISLK